MDASSFQPSSPKYDVFLSFRGEIRKKFADHLYKALGDAEVHTFRDDDEMERGRDIELELRKAIEQSRISIVLLSENYAASRWCLNELVRILKRNENDKHEVVPVFYEVHPCEVRQQIWNYESALTRLREKNSSEYDKNNKEWRAALTEIGKTTGMVFETKSPGSEAKFIQEIVEVVKCKLKVRSQNLMECTSGLASSPKYDVFFNFKEEYQKKFADHVYTALVNAGFHTFRRYDKLQIGKKNELEWQKAIEQSRVSVVLLSEDYADSRRCLDELVTILKRNKNEKHEVLPVFYEADPSEVRKQIGCYKSALTRLSRKKKNSLEYVERNEEWRAALTEVAKLTGMVFTTKSHGSEAKFIEEIVEMACTLNIRSQNLMECTSGLASSPKYDVFFNFKEEYQKNFADHVYTALVKAGFHTFRRYDKLQIGKKNELEWQKAIEQSRVSVVLLSEDYADSRRCLDELVRILKRNKNDKHDVLPVFYEVDPTDVRKQKGSYKSALNRLSRKKKNRAEYIERNEEWRAALTEVAKLAGMESKKKSDGSEAKFIQEIVKEVEKKLNSSRALGDVLI